MSQVHSTEPYRDGLGGIWRRATISWKVRNDGAYTVWLAAKWLAVHPLHLGGAALTGWLWLRGWWPPLAIAAGLLPLISWRAAKLIKLTGPPSGVRHLKEILAAARRMRQLRRHWPAAAIVAGITDNPKEGRVPKLRRATATPLGIQVDVACGMVGVPARELVKRAEKLAGRVPGCRRVTVHELATPMFARLHFIWAHPLSRPIPLSALPLPPPGQLAYGLTEDGAPATIDQKLSVFIAGMTGSGKSTAFWAVLASALACDIPIELWVIDPKGGIELAVLEGSPLVRMYAKDPDLEALSRNGTNGKNRRSFAPGTTADVVTQFHAAMVAREAKMRGTGRQHVPTKAEPLRILVIDELLRLQRTTTPVVHALLGEIVSQGRATDHMVIALSQLTQKDAVGFVRDLIPQRICLRTPNRPTTDTILRDGAEADGARCSSISKYQQGLGWAVMEDGELTQFRGVMVTDQQIEMIAGGRLPASVQRRQRQLPTAGTDTWVIYAWYAPAHPVPEKPEWKPGGIVYIGKSNNSTRRMDEHMRRSDWARLTAGHHEMARWPGDVDESVVLEREAELIRIHKPPENKMHNPDWSRPALPPGESSGPALPPGPSADGGF